MTSRAAIMFYRTTAGSDELELPQLGLSLPQRKMLRSCTDKIHLLELEQVFSGETAHYGRERFLQDLDRMVELGLLYSNAGPLAPAAVKPAPARPATGAATVYADAGIKPAARRRPRTSALRPKVVGGFFAGIMVAAGGMIWANRAEPPRIGEHAANDQQMFAEIGSDAPDSNLQAWANYIRQIDEAPARVKSGKIAAHTEAEKPAKPEKQAQTASNKASAQPAPVAQTHVQAQAPGNNMAARSSGPLAANESISETPPLRTVAQPQAASPGTPLATPAPAPTPTASAPATLPVAPPLATAPTVFNATPAAPAPAAPVVLASIAPPPLPQPARSNETAGDNGAEKKTLKLLHRDTPDFPPEALLSDVHRGRVKAKLTVDEKGNVADIQIVESKPSRLFIRPAIWSLKKWRYEGTGKTETAMVDLEFRE